MSHAILTVDLGFGDAGKGTIVDALSRHRLVNYVVRFNGGCQAAHNVVDEDGRHHTFSQFGSGTLAGIPTHLTKDVMVSPTAMMTEAFKLETIGVVNPMTKITMDCRSLMTTPIHKAINRIREAARGDDRHGSCGAGIGETKSYAIQHEMLAPVLEDLYTPFLLEQKLVLLQQYAIQFLEESGCSKHLSCLQEDCLEFLQPGVIKLMMESYRKFASYGRVLAREEVIPKFKNQNLLFESAQGVLLDEDYGFHPYTTWSRTTLANADSFLKEIKFDGTIERVGITRSYMVRHGPGPFPSEDDKLPRFIEEQHNEFGEWQRSFRMGWLDLPMLKYALRVVGRIDYLAVTHIDLVSDAWHVCRSYDDGTGARRVDLGEPLPPNDFQARESLSKALLGFKSNTVSVHSDWFLNVLETELGIPVRILSRGPRASDKQFR